MSECNKKSNANRLKMGSIQIWLKIEFLNKKLKKFKWKYGTAAESKNSDGAANAKHSRRDDDESI